MGRDVQRHRLRPGRLDAPPSNPDGDHDEFAGNAESVAWIEAVVWVGEYACVWLCGQGAEGREGLGGRGGVLEAVCFVYGLSVRFFLFFLFLVGWLGLLIWF